MSITGRLARRVADYDDPRSLGSRLRARRAGPLQSLIRRVFEERGSVRIIDVGGLRRYWNILPTGFLRDHRVEVMVVNRPEVLGAEVPPPDEEASPPARRPPGDETPSRAAEPRPRDEEALPPAAGAVDGEAAPVAREALGAAALPTDDGRLAPQGFRFVEADGCDLSIFGDASFDIAHSNSVIEHVGDWERTCRFAAEIRRVAPRYFVQTPNFWFPVEPHCMTPFFHWLPRPTRIWLVMRFALGHWPRATSLDAAVRTETEARLLNRKMMAHLFPDAEILTERFLLMPKSLVAIKR